MNARLDITMPVDADPSDFAARWNNIGLCTEPARRSEAEAALKAMYVSAGLDAPKKIVWCGSPFAQGLVRGIILDSTFLDLIAQHTWKNILHRNGCELQPSIAESFRNSMRLFDVGAVKDKLFDAVKSAVRSAMTERCNARMTPLARSGAITEVWDGVWTGVWNSVGDEVWRSIDAGLRRLSDMSGRPDKTVLTTRIKNCLKGTIGDNVKGKVWDTPMDTAWGNVRDAVSSKLRVQAWEGIWQLIQTSIWQNVAVPIGEHVKGCDNNSAQNSGYGQHDAYWLAFYAYFRETHALVKETAPVAPLMDLAGLAGWFAPHQHICWVCERPRTLALDGNGRLHAQEGAALAYPDGWNVSACNGTLGASTVLQAI